MNNTNQMNQINQSRLSRSAILRGVPEVQDIGVLLRKKWFSRSLLERGFHNNGSNLFSLGRPDPRKLETERCASDPPHQGFVDAQRPSLIVKEQGQTEHHAGLHLGKGRRLTAVRGEIEDPRLALEVILSNKE